MSKIKLAVLLGVVLGAIDGISAIFYPFISAADLLQIVPGSTVKGLLSGLAAGWAAKRFDSLGAGVGVGLIVALALSWTVGYFADQDKPGAFWPIVLPGTALGAICGFAAQRFGRPATATA